MAISVKGVHFPQDLMRMGVRWYLSLPCAIAMAKHG